MDQMKNDDEAGIGRGIDALVGMRYEEILPVFAADSEQDSEGFQVLQAEDWIRDELGEKYGSKQWVLKTVGRVRKCQSFHRNFF